MNDFLYLVSKRECCREFLAMPVEQEKLMKIMEIARLAPSACNSQPWSFIVINKPEASKKLNACLQEGGNHPFQGDCPSFIVVIEEKANYKTSVGGALSNQHCALVDIGIITSYVCLAATDLGLSTNIMGCINEAKLKKLLAINQTKRVRLVIAVGYGAPSDIKPKIRKPIEETVKYIL